MILYTKDRQYFRYDGHSQELKPVSEDEAMLELVTGKKQAGNVTKTVSAVLGFLLTAATISFLLAVIVKSWEWIR